MPATRKDRIGQKFGQWTIIADTGKTKNNASVWAVSMPTPMPGNLISYAEYI